MSIQPDFSDLKLGCILILRDQEHTSPLPLEHVTVSGTLVGGVASIRVRQQFGNPFPNPIELDYLFPLPHGAAVVDYVFTIGARTIRAELKEREAARAAYQAALDQGKRASLLEQRRPNLFSTQIGNVQPGDSIVCEIAYEAPLTYQDGAYEFVFPMGLTPRYHSPHQSAESVGSVDAPFTLPGQRFAPVEIQLTLDAGVTIADPVSPSHAIRIERQDARRVSLALAGDNIPNKDFVLRYEAASAEVLPAIWCSADGDSEIALLTLLPPRLQLDAVPDKREFIFVLDRSGSMSTEPMTQARNALRACLRALGTGDTFTIQAFDDQIEWFAHTPIPITQANVEAADRWLTGINSRGGTEILGAIDAALALPVDAERLRYVVFLTDGAVSADEDAIRKIAKQRGKARVFTFGIGPSVNRFLLDKMATLGRGRAEFVGAHEDLEAAITRFQDRVSFPVLHDIQLEWQNASAWDTYPEVAADLYVGQPLELVTRVIRTGEASVRFTGTQNGVKTQFDTPLPPPTDQPALKRLWARARIEALHDQQYQRGVSDTIRQQVISIALEHRLVTPFTSFVAVDSEVTTSGDAQRIRVSVPLPEGLRFENFAGGGFGGAAFSLGAAPASAAPGAPPPMARAITMKAKAYGSPAQITPTSADMSDKGREHMALYDKPLEKLDLSVKVFNSLKRSGITTVGDALDMFERGPNAMLAIRNLGEGSLDELFARLKAKGYLPPDTVIPSALPVSRDEHIKLLARTQNVNGSWDDNVEMTAAALLAFVRAGHTTRAGHYRPQVLKAARWLQSMAGQAKGFEAFVLVRALRELEVLSGDRFGGAEDAQKLPPPTNDIERAAANTPTFSIPATIGSLDDLRVMALAVGDASAPPELQQGVALVWLAVGKPASK